MVKEMAKVTPTKLAAKPKKQAKGRRVGVADEVADESQDPGDDGGIEGALKSVSVEGAHLIAALKGIAYGSQTGLVDGGATHCLRYGPPCEFQRSRPVEVHLASGSTQELRINAAGTLISPKPDIQPIMPMGLLASELKCDIRWDETSCTVCHPWLGSLGVTMVKNCPEVEVSLCLELIREVVDQNHKLNDWHLAQRITLDLHCVIRCTRHNCCV